MNLITGITIRGFRSIRNQRFDCLCALTSFVGKNSSGKSNILRALNLFFNDEVDPGLALDLDRDFHWIKKRKRLVFVQVDFALPDSVKFRKGLAPAQRSLTKRFTITKRWELNKQQQIVQTVSLTVGGKERRGGDKLAEQFLNLLNYRYIPNRTVPVEILRAESRAIARSIAAKVRGVVGTKSVLRALKSGAGKLLVEASQAMTRTGAPLSELSMSTATSLAEMLAVSGFQARGEHGGIVRDEGWGSGTQAFFLYQVLKAVDTTYARSFGWRQAAIWGVEEPESGLHHDLETRLAEQFRSWSSDESSKLQVFLTTHSPAFTMASECGYWIALEGGCTEAKSVGIPVLVRDAEQKGVSGWVQPVLAFPGNPVVLVEGEIDSEVLTHVSKIVGLTRIRFLALPQLDPAEKGAGKDAITAYLKRHGGLIPNRPKESPLVVLFDWEVSKTELDSAKKAYGSGADLAVIAMNAKHCVPEMGEDFKGIERFYPPSVVQEASKAGEFAIGQLPGGPIAISTSQLSIAKQRLRHRILQESDPTRLQPLALVIADIHHAVESLQDTQLPLGLP